MSELGQLHIDLFNFEDEKFEGNKYVMTCPQSLEACSRLEIKVSWCHVLHILIRCVSINLL